MEQNLSRALLMAAGVLMSLLVLALAAYLYSSFAARVEDTKKQNEIISIQMYNAKFTSYDIRENLNIQDIVSVINLAREYNINNQVVGEDSATNLYIKVNILGTVIPNLTNLENDSNYSIWNKYFKLIENTQLSTYKYKCQTTISDITGRVKSVDFTKI